MLTYAKLKIKQNRKTSNDTFSFVFESSYQITCNSRLFWCSILNNNKTKYKTSNYKRTLPPVTSSGSTLSPSISIPSMTMLLLIWSPFSLHLHPLYSPLVVPVWNQWPLVVKHSKRCSSVFVNNIAPRFLGIDSNLYVCVCCRTYTISRDGSLGPFIHNFERYYDKNILCPFLSLIYTDKISFAFRILY